MEREQTGSNRGIGCCERVHFFSRLAPRRRSLFSHAQCRVARGNRPWVQAGARLHVSSLRSTGPVARRRALGLLCLSQGLNDGILSPLASRRVISPGRPPSPSAATLKLRCGAATTDAGALASQGISNRLVPSPSFRANTALRGPRSVGPRQSLCWNESGEKLGDRRQASPAVGCAVTSKLGATGPASRRSGEQPTGCFESKGAVSPGCRDVVGGGTWSIGNIEGSSGDHLEKETLGRRASVETSPKGAIFFVFLARAARRAQAAQRRLDHLTGLPLSSVSCT